MKQFTTWLNEAQAKRYIRHVEKQKITPYSHIKQLILTDLGEEKAHVIRMSIIYAFTLYSLIVSVFVLVF